MVGPYIHIKLKRRAANTRQPVKCLRNMLSETAVEYLSSLTYRVEAKRLSCALPLAGIYWDDEIPDFRSLFELSESDRNLVFRLFGIPCRSGTRRNLTKAIKSSGMPPAFRYRLLPCFDDWSFPPRIAQHRIPFLEKPPRDWRVGFHMPIMWKYQRVREARVFP